MEKTYSFGGLRGTERLEKLIMVLLILSIFQVSLTRCFFGVKI